jgi:predicted alpha/beta-fold hydrolase
MYARRSACPTKPEQYSALMVIARRIRIQPGPIGDNRACDRSFTLFHRGMLISTAASLTALVGCFSERAFPFRPGELMRVPAPAGSNTVQDPTRAWLRRVHAELEPLLRPEQRDVLLSEDLTDDDGDPIDVYAHYGIDAGRLTSIFANLSGISHTAQASGADSTGRDFPPSWPGFADIWIPVGDGLQLGGRLGLARDDGRVRDADCIVILPGLFGDNLVLRTRELALGLREAGFHVLALESRGVGRTEARFPDVYYNFGVPETQDLLQAARWLQNRPHIQRTGLIGFCWGANLALLAPWESCRSDDDPAITSRLRPYLAERRVHGGVFETGVIACSPVLRFEEVIAQCETDWSIFVNPVLNRLQQTIRRRAEQKRHRQSTQSLRRLIEMEFARSPLDYPQAVEDALQYLRFLPYRDKPAFDKLGCADVPVLIVHGANDPLASAQALADFMATVHNPNVGAVLLPGGGHIGFAPYARRYFYSLILNFFDPRRGPAPCRPLQ